jgi:hypothetical protein
MGLVELETWHISPNRYKPALPTLQFSGFLDAFRTGVGLFR